MHVIVSYLKVICNLQAGSRDKHVFKGRFPLQAYDRTALERLAFFLKMKSKIKILAY